MYFLKRKGGRKEVWQKVDLKKANSVLCFHRKNGPAITYEDGTESWFDNGICYRVFKTENFIETYIEVKFCIIQTHSFSDKPAVIYKNGTKEWHRYGSIHRENAPAVVYANGDEEWWFLGQKHRIDGPAVIYGNKKYWFENGEFIKCIV
ncbi:MAG: hypothetical protein EKK64_06695 [Neisseriaceae bacterium]|nr:MAG: hypothetical protein EKK64_06695 [Neisseriaceae bacterium]